MIVKKLIIVAIMIYEDGCFLAFFDPFIPGSPDSGKPYHRLICGASRMLALIFTGHWRFLL